MNYFFVVVEKKIFALLQYDFNCHILKGIKFQTSNTGKQSNATIMVRGEYGLLNDYVQLCPKCCQIRPTNYY